jgi:hypothetical protein
LPACPDEVLRSKAPPPFNETLPVGKPEMSGAWKPTPTIEPAASADDDPSGTRSVMATAARSPSQRRGDRRNVRTSMWILLRE